MGDEIFPGSRKGIYRKLLLCRHFLHRVRTGCRRCYTGRVRRNEGKMNKRKMTSFLLVFALVLTTVFSTGTGTAKAEENVQKLVTVYVAAQGAALNGTKSAVIAKTPVQVAQGTTAGAVVLKVLEQSAYKDNYDFSYGFLNSINGLASEDTGVVNPNTGYTDWVFWNFGINGKSSDVLLGNYVVQDNDQIGLYYGTAYKDLFADDASKNPSDADAKKLVEAAKEQKAVLADAIYAQAFESGKVVPGIDNPNGVYTAFSLLRAGFEAKDFYQAVSDKIAEQLKKLKAGESIQDIYGTEVTLDSLDASKYAEFTYAKLVLFTTAMGLDAKNIEGVDLIEKMASKNVYAATNDYDCNREATMLLALDCADYTLPAGDGYITKEDLYTTIADSMDTILGDCIMYSSVDSVAMAVQALGVYATAKDKESLPQYEKVSAAMKQGVHFLEQMQSDEGGYIGFGDTSNVWSLSTVMAAMGSLQIQPLSEADGTDFIKNGKTVLDAAAAFVSVEDKKVDEGLMGYQPEQLLRALDASIRTAEGRPDVYNMASADVQPSTAPTPTATAKVTTTAAITTNSAVTASALTKSLKLDKKKVVVAPGKTATIKATVKAAAPATKAAALKVVKKLPKKIGTVKITGKKIKVTAAKKAVKGTSGRFIVASGDKKAVVTVKIQNKVKKAKAAKKTVTVKKGKKTGVAIKVTTENKKRATTDDVKVSVKKVAKVTRTVVINGKVTIILKGVKKGQTKMKVKVGSKTVKVTVKVK